MYKKILVPLDGSKLAECVLLHVEEFVASSKVAQLFFVRVAEPVPVHFDESTSFSLQKVKDVKESAEQIERENELAADSYLEEVVRRFEHRGVKCKKDVLVGEPAAELIKFVDENAIDLVIIATHGRSGISRWVRGSIADRILHSARAPILIVRADLCKSA